MPALIGAGSFYAHGRKRIFVAAATCAPRGEQGDLSPLLDC